MDSDTVVVPNSLSLPMSGHGQDAEKVGYCKQPRALSSSISFIKRTAIIINVAVPRE